MEMLEEQQELGSQLLLLRTNLLLLLINSSPSNPPSNTLGQRRLTACTADFTTSKRAIACQQSNGWGCVVPAVVDLLLVNSEAGKSTTGLPLCNLQAGQQHSACSSLLFVLHCQRWQSSSQSSKALLQ